MGDFAWGLAVDRDAKGKRILLHGGNIEGFSSFVAYVPAEKLAVIVLANIEGPVARDMTLKILELEQHQPTVLIGKLHQTAIDSSVSSGQPR
jgi:CubicO group peptidase (beta-lactamase class C family)